MATVGIPVPDQDRALDFYVGKLGFEKRRDIPFAGVRWVEVAPPGAATSIALISPAGRVPTGIRLTTQDADADHAGLRARGVDTDPEVIAGRAQGQTPRWTAPPRFTFTCTGCSQRTLLASSPAGTPETAAPGGRQHGRLPPGCVPAGPVAQPR